MRTRKSVPEVLFRSSVGALAATLVLGAVGACSAPTAKYEGPQSAAGQYALDHATSDFEREVLKDLMVTREEYVESIDRYVKCISDNGSSVTPLDQRGFFVFKISGDIQKYDSVAGDCATGTIRQIADYYQRLVSNPDNLDESQLKTDCVNRHGGTRDPISSDEFKQYIEQIGRGSQPLIEIDPIVFDICMSNAQS